MTDAAIRVLLVEDNATDALVVRDELACALGVLFVVQHVVRLQLALDCLADQTFDVVLLDLSLPDSDGLDTFQRLRAQALELPVLVLSHRADEQLALSSVQAGAQDYLVKGQSEGLLVRAIRHAIERAQAANVLRRATSDLVAAQRVARLGSWVWDIANRRITWSDEMYRIFGLKPGGPDQDVARLMARSIHPDDQDAVRRANRAVIENGQTQSLNYRIVLPDGAVRVVSAEAGELRCGDLGQALELRGIVQDITERALLDDTMRFLARSGENQTEGFFRPLARFLAQALGADYICIDRLVEENLSAETLAVFFDGQFDDNLTYHLQDTPCGDVVGKEVCIFPSGVRHLFPQDRALQDLQAEGYIGVTLWGNGGQPIGLIAVISRRPIAHAELVGSILKLVAARASGELEREQAAQTLRESNDLNESLLKTIPFPLDIVSAQGKVLFRNEHMAQATGWKPCGEHCWSDYRDDHSQCVECPLHQPIRVGETATIESADVLGGRVFEIRHTGMMYQGQVALLEVFVDITERKRAQEKLQLSASVFTHSREGITITDVDGTILDVNDAFVRITGYSREEAVGQNPRIRHSGRQSADFYIAMWKSLNETGQWSGEIWNRRKNGEVYPELLTISAVRDPEGKTLHYVALFTDITPMKAHQTQLEHIAHFDTLTSLPNRVLLADRLQQAMAQSQRRGRSIAVAYLDLDGFKAVNDKHGHDVGDGLLVVLAQRMKAALRDGDTLARIGGDEFVAVLVDLVRQQDFEPVLARLLEAAADPVVSTVAQGDVVLQVSASMGVTLFPQDGVDADVLLRHADQAMYAAKEAGKNRYHIFDVAQDAAVQTRRESMSHIRGALDRSEFVLYYQPKVNMKTGEVIGAEALIRWQHPERGLLPPGVFLPIIEDHPISVELGEWVIATALAQMSEWRAEGLNLPVSVNVGARQLQQGNFMDRLAALLAVHPDLQPNALELEILETSALGDTAQIYDLIRACQAMGVCFALDDFGTGYSSLTYLKRLPAEMLKIDQSFVRDMLGDPDDLAIVKGVIGLALAFKRQVIAEGVETHAHGEMLLSQGCDLAQGYGIARPMPAAAMPDWVRNWQANAVWTA
jgi:diguanylate cyclase (GGDEF)-like protein/PAS domain S-box-containing protein